MALVSIIIPTFNASKTIGQALESIFIQTFGEYEIIIVDGASTDHTVQVVQDMIKYNTCCKLISENDKGIYDAMNKGIELARGSWMYFLGADDMLFSSNVLEEAAKHLSSSSSEMMYGNVNFVPRNIFYGGAFDLIRLLKENIPHQGIFYKRCLFDKIGYFSLEYKAYADWDFNLRLFENNLQATYIPLKIAHFKTGSTSSVQDKPFLINRLIPARLANYQHEEIYPGKLWVFDQWWRIIRNSGIPWHSDYLELIMGYPPTLKKIVQIQRNIRETTLKNGYISKMLVFLNFIRLRLLKQK